MSYTESRRSIRPSAILNAYLLISLLLDVAIVRSLWLADVGAPIRGVFIAVFLVKAALLVLEAWERPSLQTDGGLRNPEATSGIYNQGLFWWINPLLADGFRRLLSPGDLYGLDESMGTAVLNEHFWVGWNRACEAILPPIPSNSRLRLTHAQRFRGPATSSSGSASGPSSGLFFWSFPGG